MPVRLITTPANNPSPPAYTFVDTVWGTLAFVSCNDRLLRLYLPSYAIKPLIVSIKRDYPHAQSAKNNLPQLQTELADYFHLPPNSSTRRRKSRQSDISLTEKNLKNNLAISGLFNCRVDISWASEFAQSILKACCRVKPGKTINYSQLALAAGRGRAARAAGSALAANRVPLIIPCHRIITANGQLGGYSAPGGKKMKAKLLEHEYRLLNPA